MNLGMVDKPVPHVLPSLMATKSGISYFDTKPAKQIMGLCTTFFVLKPWQGCVPLGKILYKILYKQLQLLVYYLKSRARNGAGSKTQRSCPPRPSNKP